jgi:hypothetical protein
VVPNLDQKGVIVNRLSSSVLYQNSSIAYSVGCDGAKLLFLINSGLMRVFLSGNWENISGAEFRGSPRESLI